MGGIGHGKHCIGAQDGYVPFPYQSGDKKTGRVLTSKMQENIMDIFNSNKKVKN